MIAFTGLMRLFGHAWMLLLLGSPLAAVVFTSSEVTNAEFAKFVAANLAVTPEYWTGGKIPAGKENEPVVLVNFHEAAGYCRFIGQRLPTVNEWKASCEGGKLNKRGDIWEWTTTDIDLGGETYKALCGPANSCDCSHRYLPQWRNGVKGFRCVVDSLPVT